MDATQLEAHFSFGENWRSFIDHVGAENIHHAILGLQKLTGEDGLKGKSFLDIGCGSGLSMLAAALMGAREVHGFDIDPNSVAATQALFDKHAPEGTIWSVKQLSVLDKDLLPRENFDIVHSWGVLHHTGAMWLAVENAASLVSPGGLFVVALYRRTPLCGFWKVEKKIYAGSPRVIQKIIAIPYIALYFLRILAKKQLPTTFLQEYRKSRGIDFYHDVHDWLGGYPYESVEIEETVSKILALGFDKKAVFDNCFGTKGVFGTGCDEYIFNKT